MCIFKIYLNYTHVHILQSAMLALLGDFFTLSLKTLSHEEFESPHNFLHNKDFSNRDVSKNLYKSCVSDIIIIF